MYARPFLNVNMCLLVFRELHLKLNTERKNKEKLEDKVVQNTESEGKKKNLIHYLLHVAAFYLEASP